MNILDYLDWRGDILFSERGLNEVDNLIFATLAYTNMENLVKENTTVEELYQSYIAAGYDQSHMIINPFKLLEKAAHSQRYKDVSVRYYVNNIDTEKHLQFSAVTFLFENTVYVAFRGTDNTLTGWREDFNMSYLPNTPGQYEAMEYLNMAAEKFSGELIVGGHSKGGNFAAYAAAFCNAPVKKRIAKVYSNDGPGFNSNIVNSDGYKSIIPKIEHIITDSSVVGILLSHKLKSTVIKSSAFGIDQHNPYTWNVIGTHFEKADGLSVSSVFMNDTADKWINSLSDDSKKILINSIFDSLESSGASTLNDIANKKWEVYNAATKAIALLSIEKKSDIGHSIKKLFDAGKDTIIKGLNRNQ